MADQGNDMLTTLPNELLSQILAGVTRDLPHSNKGVAHALVAQFEILEAVHPVLTPLVRDAHFRLNRQWAPICVRVHRFGKAHGVIAIGSFRETALFFDNVRHLGLGVPQDDFIRGESTWKIMAAKICQLIHQCDALMDVTLCLDNMEAGLAELVEKEVINAVREKAIYRGDAPMEMSDDEGPDGITNGGMEEVDECEDEKAGGQDWGDEIPRPVLLKVVGTPLAPSPPVTVNDILCLLR